MPTAVEIVQFRLQKMALCAYLVGDPATRTAVLIDPAFEPGRILKQVKQRGYRVTRIVNTHGHADHTAGNAAVLQATGARLAIHAADAARLNSLSHRLLCRLLGGRGSPPADDLLSHGDRIAVGAFNLEVLHTPGHTPGGICLYLAGHVFTGDTLFVGGVGRVDLPGGSLAELLTAIRTRLWPLPEDTRVWPGHDYGAAAHSTVAREKTTNPYVR